MIQEPMIFQWLSFRLVQQQNYHHVSLGKAEASLFKAKRTCINILCGRCRSMSDRIIKYPELEGAHRDYQIQLLALNRTSQQSHPVFEGTVQMLLELQQVWGHDHSLGSLFSLSPPQFKPSDTNILENSLDSSVLST